MVRQSERRGNGRECESHFKKHGVGMASLSSRERNTGCCGRGEGGEGVEYRAHKRKGEYTKRPACPWLAAAQRHAGPDFRIYHVQPSAHQRDTLGRRSALSSESSARLLFHPAHRVEQRRRRFLLTLHQHTRVELEGPRLSRLHPHWAPLLCAVSNASLT